MIEDVASTSIHSRQWRGLVGRALKHLPIYALPALWSLFTLFCVVWIILTSFRTNRELFSNVWALPTGIQYENYVKAWTIAKLGIQFRNSVIIVSASVILLLVLCAPAAYVLSRMKFRGNGLLTVIFVAGAGVPLPLLFIPLFGLTAKLHINNTLPGLIIIYIIVSVPFTMYLLTGFFRSLPTELEEAARLDGCSEFNVFWRVMLPLASPGLITATIFNFIALWNEYMLAMVFLNDPNKMPISRGLYGIAESMQYTGDWVGLFAGVVIVMVPTVIIYVLLSERLIEGVTMGALK
jgi:N-acetylglucosamine transport system permease protein